MKTEKILTIDEAYDAMYDFLDKYYDKNKSDDLGGLLSDISLWADETSADPAMLEDWNESVEKILTQKQLIYPSQLQNEVAFMKTKKILTQDQAYNAMFDFVEGYCKRINSDDIQSLLDIMKIDTGNIGVNHAILNDWNKSVTKILTQKDRVRPYLQFIK